MSCKQDKCHKQIFTIMFPFENELMMEHHQPATNINSCMNTMMPMTPWSLCRLCEHVPCGICQVLYMFCIFMRFTQGWFKLVFVSVYGTTHICMQRHAIISNISLLNSLRHKPRIVGSFENKIFGQCHNSHIVGSLEKNMFFSSIAYIGVIPSIDPIAVNNSDFV